MKSKLEHLLDRLAGAVVARPRRFLFGTVVAGVLSAGLFFFFTLDQDISALFPKGDSEVAVLASMRSTMAGTNFALILLTVERPDPSTLREASDRLAETLLREETVTRVRWRITEEEKRFYSESFLSRAFLFLPPEALDTALEKLTPDGMEREIAKCERLLGSPLPGVEERIRLDPLNLFEDVFIPVMKRRAVGARLDLETGHTLSADGRAALVQVWGRNSPQDLAYARTFMKTLRKAISHVEAEPSFSAGGLRMRVTGGYPVALENERSVKRNLIVSFVGAFAGVLLLFMAVFRSLRVNLTVGLPLAVGVTCAFGVAVPVLGFRMTAIAAAFGAILVGLAIDFPIHLYHRFREERASGLPPGEAVRRALSSTGPGVVSAALTTSMAFGLLALASFRGMVEVGLFVGLGMLAILAVMLTLLPALLVLVEGRKASPKAPGFRFGLHAFERAQERFGILLASGAVFVTLVAGLDILWRGGVPFESDLRKLRSPSPEAEEANAAIGAHFGLSLNPILAVVRGTTRREALERAADVDALLEPLVDAGKASSILGPGAYVAGPLRTLRCRKRMEGLDPAGTVQRLEAILEKHDFDPEPFRDSLDRLRDALAVATEGAREALLDRSWETIYAPFLARDGEAFLAVTVLYLPESAGTREHLEAGAEARRLARDRLGQGGVVTSVDLLIHRLKALVLGELAPITGLVALAVVLVALVHFRHPLWALYALIPAGCGFLITLSAMKSMGLSLNFMNVVIFPMILGIGVDDGIHFVHRWREKRGGSWRGALHGAGMPIVMTSLTSMVGFGSLILADNAGLRSMGWVAVIGLSACMGCTLLILPFLCRISDQGIGRIPDRCPDRKSQIPTPNPNASS